VGTPRVFHGESPVNPEGRLPAPDPGVLQIFLGEPLQIDAVAVSVRFRAVDGANLITIAPSLEALNFLSRNLVIQLLRSPLEADILVADALPMAKERWAELAGARAKFLATPQQVESALDGLVAELEARRAAGDVEWGPKVFFLIEPQGSGAFPLGASDSFGEPSPAARKIKTLLEQGPRRGIHTVLFTSRLSRTEKVLANLGRFDLQPFGFRAAFRSEETSNLLGYNVPIKTLGEYTGLFYEESTGEVVPFQVYAAIE